MRAATVFNFLIEATLMGSIMIILLMVVRRFLRPQLGSRLICLAWLMVAIRLIVPLALPNPMMNEIRPVYSENMGVRPIADQVRVRTSDALGELAFRMSYDTQSQALESLGRGIQRFNAETSYGHTARWMAWGYAAAAFGVLGWMIVQNRIFRKRLRRDRVEALTGREQALYQRLCSEHGVKPIPVYWVDPLPSACLAGAFKPCIALPLTLDRSELEQVLNHEICHFKAGDHWWGILRNLCCAVHWFNPLVWLGARMSRADQELACDERVTACMTDDERLRYANTLALAAARRNAPRLTVLATGMTMKGKEIKRRIRAIVDHRANVRWLCIAALAVAAAGTLFSFGTAELLPKLETPTVPVLEGEQVRKRSISSPEEAVSYAREILASAPYLPSPSLVRFDSFDMLEWDTLFVQEAQVWQVTCAPAEDQPGGVFDLVLGADGTIWRIADHLFAEETVQAVAANPTYRTDRAAREPLYQYARDYARFVVPDLSLEEMYIDADYWLDDTRYVNIRSGDLYFLIAIGESPYICRFGFAISAYTDIWNALSEASRQRSRQAQEQAIAEAVQETGTEFLPMGSIEDGTELDRIRDMAHGYLTEVYSYPLGEADEFVFGLQQIDGKTWCVYFHPAFPAWRYGFAVDDPHGTAFSPYRQSHVNASEGALRYFLEMVWKEGWLADWNERARNALADETHNELHDIRLSDEIEDGIRSGTLDQGGALKAVFEAVYPQPSLWNEALAGWYNASLVRFGCK